MINIKECQEALNWFRDEVTIGYSAPDTYFKKVHSNVDVLQDLIDEHQVLEKALDIALSTGRNNYRNIYKNKKGIK